jgi:hypothetical protein
MTSLGKSFTSFLIVSESEIRNLMLPAAFNIMFSSGILTISLNKFDEISLTILLAFTILFNSFVLNMKS